MATFNPGCIVTKTHTTKCQHLHDEARSLNNTLMPTPSYLWDGDVVARLKATQQLATECDSEAAMCLQKKDQSSCDQLPQCAWLR